MPNPIKTLVQWLRPKQELSPDEVQEALSQQKEYLRFSGHIEASSVDAAQKAWEDIQAEYLANPSDQAWQALNEEHVTFKEIKRRFSERNALAYEALRRFACERMRPFLVPIVRRCADAFEARALEVETRDKQEHAELGAAYTPTALVQKLRNKAACLRSTADAIDAAGTSQGSPLQILKECGIKVDA